MPTVIQPAKKPLPTIGIKARQVRDLLLSLPDNERMFIMSDPKPGQHRVISIRRNASGNPEYDFEQTPE